MRSKRDTDHPPAGVVLYDMTAMVGPFDGQLWFVELACPAHSRGAPQFGAR